MATNTHSQVIEQLRTKDTFLVKRKNNRFYVMTHKVGDDGKPMWESHGTVSKADAEKVLAHEDVTEIMDGEHDGVDGLFYSAQTCLTAKEAELGEDEEIEEPAAEDCSFDGHELLDLTGEESFEEAVGWATLLFEEAGIQSRLDNSRLWVGKNKFEKARELLIADLKNRTEQEEQEQEDHTEMVQQLADALHVETDDIEDVLNASEEHAPVDLVQKATGSDKQQTKWDLARSLIHDGMTADDVPVLAITTSQALPLIKERYGSEWASHCFFLENYALLSEEEAEAYDLATDGATVAQCCMASLDALEAVESRTDPSDQGPQLPEGDFVLQTAEELPLIKVTGDQVKTISKNRPYGVTKWFGGNNVAAYPWYGEAWETEEQARHKFDWHIKAKAEKSKSYYAVVVWTGTGSEGTQTTRRSGPSAPRKGKRSFLDRVLEEGLKGEQAKSRAKQFAIDAFLAWCTRQKVDTTDLKITMSRESSYTSFFDTITITSVRDLKNGVTLSFYSTAGAATDENPHPVPHCSTHVINLRITDIDVYPEQQAMAELIGKVAQFKKREELSAIMHELGHAVVELDALSTAEAVLEDEEQAEAV